jgi:LysM repeat protein
MTSNSFLNQTHSLIKALFISGGINILLLTITIYSYFTDRPTVPTLEQKPASEISLESPIAVDKSCHEVIRYFKSLTYEQLVANLKDSRLVENGYTQRDLALAVLISCHHYDFPRALKGMPQPVQKRLIIDGMRQSGKALQVIAYPGLTDRHFQSIITFAQTEKWPQTTQGMFANLQKQKELDPSLIDAFYQTPEFSAVETLFKRADVKIEKNELLKVIIEGSWPLLNHFTEQQKVAQDLSPAKRQRFLLEYVKASSKSAAYLLLKTDLAFATKKLDDDNVLAILDLIDQKTPETEKFALDLLTNPRIDAVWKMAAKKAKQQPVPERTYIVQNGDNLWKIARRFHVDIDSIRSRNHIEGDSLRPGNVLRIP